MDQAEREMLVMGLARESSALRWYAAGWLLVALDLAFTTSTTTGRSVSSCAIDVLPDVVGLCMMAASVGRFAGTARGLGTFAGTFGWAGIVIWMGAPVALLDFVPSVAEGLWPIPLAAAMAVGVAQIGVSGALQAWTAEAGLPRAASWWGATKVLTAIGVGILVLGMALRLGGGRLELGCAGAVAAVGLVVGQVVCLLAAVGATTGHPRVRGALGAAGSNPGA